MNFFDLIDLFTIVAFGLADENMLTILIVVLEIVPVLYMLKAIVGIAYSKISSFYNGVMDRCAIDINYRNDVVSYIYFFKDLGPNTAAFSVVTLIAQYSSLNTQTVTLLTIIFIVGIMFKQKSRKFTNWFYSEIKKRGAIWEQDKS